MRTNGLVIAAGFGLAAWGVAAGCASQDEAVYIEPDAGVVDAHPDVPVLGSDACSTTCSDDGLSVLCDGKVVETCSEALRCKAGRCQSACDLAEASQSSVGCDYFVPVPDTKTGGFAITGGSCFATFIVNTWTDPVDLQIDYDGDPYDARRVAYVPTGKGLSTKFAPLADGRLPPGQVAVVFLQSSPAAATQCPDEVTPAAYADMAYHGTGLAKAFHIRTSAPVVAYDIYPYGGGKSEVTGATLLLPTSVWGTNYLGVSAFKSPEVYGETAVSWMSIVAKEDGTDVTLSPTADIKGSEVVTPTKKGQPQTYTLNRGQVLQFAQKEELTGTPIQSTKPVGVWGGSQLLLVPFNTYTGDAAHQQIPPIRALGHEYVAVHYRDRYEGVSESTSWRIVGAVDGTTLTYVPQAPPDAPTTLSSGQVVDFEQGDPFLVRAQDDKHPFYMASYMSTGIIYDPTFLDARGDPEFVNVIPTGQFLNAYTFFTDPTYPETNLVVVRKKGDKGFADVTLDCAGPLTGWTPLGDAYEWTRTDLVRHDFEPQGNCDNGRHVMSSDAPFGLTVWGWGTAETGGLGPLDPTYSQAVSYAYPAGAGVLSLTDVVVPPVPK